MGILQQFAQKAGTVLQTPAVLVSTLVVALQEHEHGDREGVPGIAVDDIETGLFGPQGGLTVPAAQVAQIFSVGGARLGWEIFRHAV